MCLTSFVYNIQKTIKKAIFSDRKELKLDKSTNNSRQIPELE